MYNCAGSGYEQSSMASECFPSDPSLQILPSRKEVSEILQHMCGEISQTTTAEIVEVANSAASRSQLQELLPIYFHSWQLQSPEAVIIYLLLHYFILRRDGSKRREDRLALEESIERLKSRIAELEKKLYENRTEVHQTKAELEERREPDPELMKQVQGWRLKHGKVVCAHELCQINNQWALDCASLAQRISALEEHIEQLNDRMRELEEKLEETQHPDSLIPVQLSYPKPVENCCASSVFVHGSLVYEFPSASACPVHQDVSPHT